jgi:uncharacterized protein YheU (UPF0270 family)
MDDTAEPLQIPPELLSPEALRGVLEDFVLREGTDYGLRDWSLEEKVAQVATDIRHGGGIRRAKVDEEDGAFGHAR